ncbi:hypothetical protein [Nocardioides sp. SR21]|uniref:hypothetical protein n=1 Tax=Nocardioides sp. SR21 TaxID=2919501 RepID=UPI001FA9D91B|nr:hypothetical protein [Nocardioides sp. SR21]
MLPVTALAVGLVALLAALVPGVRDQVALSLTHEQQEYVALSFARDPAGKVPVCVRSGKDLLVGFAIDSQLQQARTVEYVVTVGSVRRVDTVDVEPGEVTRMTEAVKPPRGSFPVSVSLPDLDRRITAHCEGRPQ